MGLSRTHTSPADSATPPSQAALLAQLHDGDAQARRQAARSLRSFPSVAKDMGIRLLLEDEDSVREAIFNSLVAIGDDEAVMALLPLLGMEDDANLRNGAIEALKQLPAALSPHMREMLCDADPDRRIFAVNICESLRSREIESWLLEVIARDDHVNVCATAVDLLGEVGTDAAIAPLHALAKRFNGDPFMQFAVSLALRRIGEVTEKVPS